jgi:hypothetical protein
VGKTGIPLRAVRAPLAGGGLGEDAVAAVSAKFVELPFERLIRRRDAGVADELHGDLLLGGARVRA